jgi:hypothetical protein
MKDRRGTSVLALAVTALGLPACATEDIEPNLVIASDQSGPDKGGVVVAFAPLEDSYETARQETQYRVLLDGNAVSRSGGSDLLHTNVGGNPEGVRYLNAGPHHFTVEALGGKPVFEGDGQVPGGGTAYLFLFGPLDAVQGLFLSIPDVPSAGNEHVTVVNLMRSGQTIEVVSCVDATTCTPMSPALAIGDIFDAEVPAVLEDCDPSFQVQGSAFDGGCFTSRPTRGAGIGYRLVPSASLPDPPVNALTAGAWDSSMNSPRPAIFVAAPIYMSDQGQSQFVFN